MASRLALSRTLPGIVFALLVSLALARTVVQTAARRNEAALQAAAQARLAEEQARQAADQARQDAVRAAEQAAESARQSEALRIAEHRRVGRKIIGTWSGRFHVDRAHLNIARSNDSFVAILLDGLAQAVYQGELADRDNPTRTVLLLTPVSQSGETRGGDMFHRPLFVTLDEDGEKLNGRTDNNDIYCCRIEMRRVTEIDGASGAALTELFKERSVKETEFVPTGEIRLYNEPGDFTWDSLSLREINERQLHLFDTGVVANAHGSEYHHIVVRGPNEKERKGWTRWNSQ